MMKAYKALAATRLAAAWISAVGYFTGSVILTILAAITFPVMTYFGITHFWNDALPVLIEQGFTFRNVFKAFASLFIPGLVFIDMFGGFKEFRGLASGAINHNVKLYYEFFGPGSEIAEPFFGHRLEGKTASPEQKITWRSVLSALWWLIVVATWIAFISAFYFMLQPT